MGASLVRMLVPVAQVGDGGVGRPCSVTYCVSASPASHFLSAALTFPSCQMRKLRCPSLGCEDSISRLIFLKDTKTCVRWFYIGNSWDRHGGLLQWLVWGQLLIFQGSVQRAVSVLTWGNLGVTPQDTRGSPDRLLRLSEEWLIRFQSSLASARVWSPGSCCW